MPRNEAGKPQSLQRELGPSSTLRLDPDLENHNRRDVCMCLRHYVSGYAL